MKKILFIMALISLFAVTAQADITFGGKTWQTLGNTHRDHPEVTSEFTVLDGAVSDVGYMRGVYGADTAMYTPITIVAGDAVSFDWYLSNNGNNIPDYNGGAYYGNATFQFKTVVESGTGNRSTAGFETNNNSGHHWYTPNNGGNWYDNGNYDLNLGLHVEYVFGQTQYTLTIYSLADPSVVSTLTRDYNDSGTVADIECFRVGIYDSEQDVTVAGFAHYSIVPQNGATLVNVDDDLAWTLENRDSGWPVDIYFGTESDPNTPLVASRQNVTTYEPGTLENDSTYYWRIDAREPNAVDPGNPAADIIHVGPTWSFSTLPEIALVTIDPVSQTVSAGTTVQLVAAAINATTYQWRKDGQDLSDGGKITGATTDTLTITDVQLAEEGSYACIADNELNIPDPSDSAQIMTQRLVGKWELDGNLLDSVQEEVPGAPVHDGVCDDPNYVAVGINVGALEFFGNVEGLVKITDSNDYFNFYPRGYTVSVWVNTTQDSGWMTYLAKQRRPEAPWIGFLLTQQDGQPIHALRQQPQDNLYSNVQIADGAWHLVTCTFDPATELTIYVDGVLKNQRTASGTPDTTSDPLIFGGEIPSGTVSPFVGMLDDIRIWSYPLDPYDIAALYTDFNPGEWVCVEYPKLDVTGPEGAPDCRIDLNDFLAIAEVWLTCNRVPQSDCID